MHKSTLNALIVEDSCIMRKMMTIALEAVGDYDVVEAEDGIDALDKLERSIMRGITPNFVITDVNMPNMDGIAFIKKIREIELCKEIPILVLTSESDPKKKEEGFNAGANHWLLKPFKVKELHELIDNVIH